MTSALEKKYKSCHHDRAHQVIPEIMQMLAPGEQISVNFATFNKRNFMVVKDRVSGMIWARATKDQTTNETFMAVMEWS